MCKHCQTCQFWGNAPPLSDRAVHARFRPCDAPAFHLGYRYLARLDCLADDQVVVEDDEGWGLLTGPRFGCVHWQARAESNEEEREGS